MSTIGGVGQGVTLGLSVNATVARLRNVQMPEWLAERVDFTGLDATSWMAFVPGSPTDPGQFTAEAFFDTELAVPTHRIIQTATFTFPIQTAGNTTQATLVGSGFVTGVGYPNAAVAEPMIQTLSFAYEGSVGTPPAFTLELP